MVMEAIAAFHAAQARVASLKGMLPQNWLTWVGSLATAANQVLPQLQRFLGGAEAEIAQQPSAPDPNPCCTGCDKRSLGLRKCGRCRRAEYCRCAGAWVCVCGVGWRWRGAGAP